MRLSDKQWERIKDLVPDGARRSDCKSRPWRDKREVLEGILWIVRTGAPWKNLLKHFLPYQTCHRHFQQWVESDMFDKIIEALAQDLQQRGKVDMSECFINGSFSLAKKGLTCGQD